MFLTEQSCTSSPKPQLILLGTYPLHPKLVSFDAQLCVKCCLPNISLKAVCRVKCWVVPPDEEKVDFFVERFIIFQSRKCDPDVHSTALLLTCRGEKRSVVHYQWVSWPDKFVPKQITVPFTLLSSARARKTPTVIHCSAGIGRTGTLVTLELLARYCVPSNICKKRPSVGI